MTRRITRTEKDGKITVLADKFEGKRLNAPNDIVVKSDDSIWFTDPLFGINGEWEGKKEKPEQATTNVYRIAKDGKLTAVLTDLVNPNGWRSRRTKRSSMSWSGRARRTAASGAMTSTTTARWASKTKLIDAADQGALDGFRVDRDGNLWCGWGCNGALQSEPTDVGGRKVFQLKGKSEDLDGVMVFSPDRQAARLHPPAGALRQSHLRRPEEQPPLHDKLPLGLRALRGVARGGLSNNPVIPGRDSELRCALAHRESSRFRVWSFGPSRNDDELG